MINQKGVPAFPRSVRKYSAFPKKRSVHHRFDVDNLIHDPPQDGMDLRDWFAGYATEQDTYRWQTEGLTIAVTREAAKYRYADAMIAERERK
jgi:hypothetical protein